MGRRRLEARALRPGGVVGGPAAQRRQEHRGHPRPGARAAPESAARGRERDAAPAEPDRQPQAPPRRAEVAAQNACRRAREESGITARRTGRTVTLAFDDGLSRAALEAGVAPGFEDRFEG